MKSLNKPDIKVEDIYCLCAKNFRDENLVARLLSCKKNIIEASDYFDKLAKEHETYKMNEEIINKGIVSDKELKNVYTKKFAKPNSIGKKYYSEILAIPKNNLCPLCGTRIVSTLDHYLAKSKYPSLVVTPNNLIAVCRDCNFDKSDLVFVSSDDETLHPYYDNIENHRWIYCDIIESEPIGFKYSVKIIDTFDKKMYKRIQNHFEIFQLGRLFSIKASELIFGIETMLRRLYSRAGEEAVRLQIEEDMLSQEAVSLNSWQSAFYRGIYNSEWFFTDWIR